MNPSPSSDVGEGMYRQLFRILGAVALMVGGVWSAGLGAASSKLQLFYAVHVHALGMEGSAFDTSLARLDRTAAHNIGEALVALGDTLERHGARASFQLTHAALSAVCQVKGPGLLQGLAAEGHDVGVHGHDPSEIVRATQALKRQCGLTARTGSGLVGPGTVRAAGGGRPPGRRGGGGISSSVFVSGALDAQRSGLEVLTLNATASRARNPAIIRACNGPFGNNALRNPASGALPFSWHPDLGAGDICGDSPRGTLVLMDHAPGDWLLDPQGNGRDSVDRLSDTEFAQLKPLVQAALTAPRRADSVHSWGFVSHLHEFMPGTSASLPVASESLAALDRWLDWVNRSMAGQGVWSTPPVIARLEP